MKPPMKRIIIWACIIIVVTAVIAYFSAKPKKEEAATYRTEAVTIDDIRKPGPSPDKKPSDYQDASRDLISQRMEQFRQGNHGEGAALLIDAILELKPEFVMLEQRFVDDLVPAKELFKEGKFQEGAKAVSELLIEINQAYPNQIPYHPRGPSQSLAEVFSSRIKLAVEYIQHEAPDIGAIFILEVLTLIIQR